MSKDFFKVKKGLHIKPSDPSTLTDLEDGDIIVDSTDNQLKKYSEEDGEFATIAGSGGAVANFFSEFDKLTPTLAQASVADDAVVFLPIDDNKKSKKITYTAAGSALYEVAASADLEGAQGLMTIWIKTDVQGVTVSTTTDGVKQSTLSVLATGKWKQYEIPYVVGGTNQGLIVESANSGDVNIDEPFVGLAPAGYIQDVGQAQFVGSLVYREAGCSWQTSRTDLGSFSADANCVATQITGNIAAPDTFIPAIKILNPRTDGYYKVSNYAQFITTSGGTGNNTCEYALSQDGSTASYTMFAETSDSQWSGVTISNLNDSFRFTDTTDKTIQVITRVRNNGNNAVCRTYGNTDAGLTSKWEVHFYPDASNTIVAQDAELVKVEGRASNGAVIASGSPINFTEVVDNTNSWDNSIFTAPKSAWYSINGAIRVQTSTSLLAYSYVNGVVKNLVTDNLSNLIIKFNDVVYLNAGDTYYIAPAGSIDLLGVTSTVEHYIVIQEDARDAKVIGKFENINSSDLVVVRAQHHNGATVSLTQPFNFPSIIEDNFNAFDGTTFTAPKTGKYLVSGMTRVTTNSTYYLRFNINGTTGSFATSGGEIVNNPDVYRKFNGIVTLNEGDVFDIRPNLTLTSQTTDSFITLTIQELPNTEAIVKNLLAESSQTKCQRKYLTADLTASADPIADLTFNNLVLGKKYQVNLNAHGGLSAIGNGFVDLFTKNGSDVVALFRRGHRGQIGGEYYSHSNVYTFTATATTLTFDYNNAGTSVLRGNSTNSETWVELCQLPDTVVDTEEF